MDTSQDFVVVNEEKESPETAALKKLHILIDLFSKSMDAVNQSNILLKDELRAALSVTLQHVPADNALSTEEIINTLEKNVTSNEAVRANYIRRLCSRLVAVNDEKNTLLTENVELKEQLDSKAKVLSDQLSELSTTIQDMQTMVDRLESSSKPTNNDDNNDNDTRSSTPETLEDDITEPTTLSCLCTDLSVLRNRLAQLTYSAPSFSSPRTNALCDVSIQTDSMEASFVDHTAQVSLPSSSSASEKPKACASAVQTDSTSLLTTMTEVKESYVAPTVPAPPYPFNALITTNPFHEDDVASSTNRIEESRSSLESTLITANRLSSSLLPNVGARLQHLIQDLARNPLTSPIAAAQVQTLRQDQTPSFHACDEEPWCPCCSQRFASRADLEEHLPSCLE